MNGPRWFTPRIETDARDNARMTASPGWRLVPAALLLAACSPTLDWRDVRVDDGAALTALFPCKPQRRARALQVGAAPVRLEVAACEAGDDTYAVGFFDVAEPAVVGPALEILRKGVAANIGDAAAVAAPYALPGMTPSPFAARIDAAGRRPDGSTVRAHAVFFARGLRVYQASVIGAAPKADAVNAFIGGLKLAS